MEVKVEQGGCKATGPSSNVKRLARARMDAETGASLRDRSRNAIININCLPGRETRVL